MATKVANGGFGVFVHQGGGAASSNNTIGGTAAGAGNIIGFNKEGVVIGDSLTDTSKQDAIPGNSIFQSSVRRPGRYRQPDVHPQRYRAPTSWRSCRR